ncbi:MAG: MurR/RpiR family transcriptional regulator [Burkholderiaceae bacterium]
MLQTIASSSPSLPPAEARVATLLLNDPEQFVRLPVGELAKQAGVSNPTVIRFCRSLGKSGLSEFKLALAAGLAREQTDGGEPFVHAQVGADDSVEQVILKLMQGNSRALMDFANRSDASAFESASRALGATIEARGRIEFYGVGNSGIVAQDAQHKFFRLGCNTVAYADSHLQLMAASSLGKQDTAVVISNSGCSREVLEAARIARTQGATVIAITASNTPLAASCKTLLAADHAESHDQYSPMVSRLLHLSIVDILATTVALSLGEATRERQRRIKSNLKRVRGAQ